MGLRTASNLDTRIERRTWSVEGEDPLLVAALAAALVEYRGAVGRANREQAQDDARSNWRVVTRVTQLRQL